jgi:hypothetical protein
VFRVWCPDGEWQVATIEVPRFSLSELKEEPYHHWHYVYYERHPLSTILCLDAVLKLTKL